MGHLFSSVLLAISSNVDAFAVGIAYGVKKVRIGVLANLLIAFVSGVGTVISMEAGEFVSKFLPAAVANALGSGVLVAIGIWSIWEALRTQRQERRDKYKASVEQVPATINIENTAIVEVDVDRRFQLKEPWFLASLMVVSSVVTANSAKAGGIVGKVLPNTLANGFGSTIVVALGIWGVWQVLRKQQKVRNNQSSVEQLSYNTYVENPEIVDVDKSRRVELKESWALAFALTINNLGNGLGAGISGLDIGLTTGLTFIASLLAIIVGYFLGDKFTTKLSGIWPGIVSGVFIITLGVYEYFQ